MIHERFSHLTMVDHSKLKQNSACISIIQEKNIDAHHQASAEESEDVKVLDTCDFMHVVFVEIQLNLFLDIPYICI